MKQIFNSVQKNQNGAAALFTVLVVGAAALLMARGASVVGLGSLEDNSIAENGAGAYYLADGCVREALWRIRNDSNFEATNLLLPQTTGECRIDVVKDNDLRTITVVGHFDEYYKKITIEAQINNGAVVITKHP